MAESGAKLDSPLAQRLQEFKQAESDLTKLLSTTKAESARRDREVKSLTALIGRQQAHITNLASKNARVVLLEEYRSIRLSIILNHQNLTLARQMLREAHKQVSAHETKLKFVQSAIASIQKELEDRGRVLPFDRKAS